MRRLTVPLISIQLAMIGLGIVTIWLFWVAVLIADAAPGELFVTTTGVGTACTQSSPCSLQTALSMAVDGDTMIVAGGIYTHTAAPLVEVSNDTTLYGGWDGGSVGPVRRDPVAFPTILDGQRQGQVVVVEGDLSPTLDGFVITHGNAVGGAGIALYLFGFPGAAPVIRNSLIVDNEATGSWGGGILMEGGRPLIEHNRIIRNTTSSEGGGVAVAFDSHPTIKDNLISGNSAQVSGAGIRLRDAWVTLANNTLADNFGAGADGIYASNTTITLTNNIITSNNYGLRTDGTITPTIAYNDIWGNTTANFEGLADPTGSDGNISLNPRFVFGPEGGYYLSQIAAGQAVDSPAVNSGSDLAFSLGLEERTTRTDGMSDQNIVDLGYHYQAVVKIYLAFVVR